MFHSKILYIITIVFKPISNFENVCDPDLIDSYIYEINALSFRYKYLLRQVQSIQTNAEFTPQIRDLHQPRYQSSH